METLFIFPHFQTLGFMFAGPVLDKKISPAVGFGMFAVVMVIGGKEEGEGLMAGMSVA